MTNPLPRACKSINDLNVGDTFRLKYSISDSDVQKFGEISGDFNPAHFNEEYAKGTIFKNRIAQHIDACSRPDAMLGEMAAEGARAGHAVKRADEMPRDRVDLSTHPH